MHENATNFLPFFGTDIGLCSLVKPQLNFNDSLQHLSFSEKMFGPKGQEASYSREIKTGAKVSRYFLILKRLYTSGIALLILRSDKILSSTACQ
jgi:hypothetical protein